MGDQLKARQRRTFATPCVGLAVLADTRPPALRGAGVRHEVRQSSHSQACHLGLGTWCLRGTTDGELPERAEARSEWSDSAGQAQGPAHKGRSVPSPHSD